MNATAQTIALPPPAVAADDAVIRYGQCWEDADVLLEGLDIQPGDTCLAIASAGDNALAMLTRHPARVMAVDVSTAQLACLALRVAAYRRLDHAGLLELVGSRSSDRRRALYDHCRPALAVEARRFWDARPHVVEAGIGEAGRFERMFRIFRRRVLPLCHPPARIEQLLRGGTDDERLAYYEKHWNNRRWRLLLRLFCSRPVVERLGRDPRFFRHVEGGIAGRMDGRIRHALTALDPSENPYLQWILTGRHRTALPLALREEHFETIRRNLDRLTWHHDSLEDCLHTLPADTIDRFNLSDVFEYVARPHYHALLDELVRVGRVGGRLAYWNLFVDRQRPARLAHALRPLDVLAERLHAQDRAFFYQRFVVEEMAHGSGT